MAPKFRTRKSTFTSAIVVMVVAGCMDAGTAPESPPPGSSGVRMALAEYNRGRKLGTADGKQLEAAAMQPGLTELTRYVALALADPGLRALVYRDMQRSPYAEHKLHLRSFLDGSGNAVGKKIRESSRRSREGLLASLDSLVDLEMYMPVQAHYAKWKGGNNIIVASLLQDGDQPVAFDLNGRPVTVRANTPPNIPTLVLVKSETDFTSAPAPQFEMACPDGCGGGGGGGTTDPAPTPTPPPPTPGIRMLSMTLIDDGEDNFFRGAPEIEVMFMGRRNSGYTNLAAVPANESSTTERRFDMNSGSYSAPSPGILIVSRTELDALFARFPTLNLDKVPFTIAVWEDDTDRGRIVDEDNWWSLALNTVQTVTWGLLGATDVQSSPCGPDEGGSCKPGGPLTVLGVVAGAISFGRLLTDLGQILTGDNDEYLGMAVGAHVLFNATGTTTVKTHALMQGRKKMGEITLQYRQ
jgi:hypothetical protein